MNVKKRIIHSNNNYYVWYIVKTTGPTLLTDIIKYVKHNHEDIYNYIHILPQDQYNICNYCNKCSPSKTKKLYAVRHYSSSWTDKKWLFFRNFYSCLSFIDIILIFIVFYIIYLLYFRNFSS